MPSLGAHAAHAGRRDALPASALTPEGLQRALAEYVTFGSREPSSAAAGGTGLPRKGMSPAEAEAALGTRVDSSHWREGLLEVVTRTSRTD